MVLYHAMFCDAMCCQAIYSVLTYVLHDDVMRCHVILYFDGFIFISIQCDALRGLVELPLPFELRNSDLPVQAIAEAVRGKVSHTQMEHAPCVRKEASI